MLLMSLFLSLLWACSSQQQQEAELQLEQEMTQQGAEEQQGEAEQLDQEVAQQEQGSYDGEESEEALSQNQDSAGEGEYSGEFAEESYNSANTNDLESLINDEGDASAEEVVANDLEADSNGLENMTEDSVNDELTANAAVEEEVSYDAQENQVADQVDGQAAPVAQPGEGLPELGSKMSYVVQRGETLSIIAGQIYGDMNKWREISNLTGLENPNRIYPGDVVYYQLTDATMAFATSYENVPRGEVEVNSGDTLAKIAKNIYGDQGQWKSIWRQNDQIENTDKLEVGQVIYFVNNQKVMAQKEIIESLMKTSVSAESAVEVPSVEDLEKEVETLESLTMLDNVASELLNDV
jgi:nucleoid-associated protein YgaU